MVGRVFSEQLYQIRDIHIEVESILQSLAALHAENPCASCLRVCCKEVLCRESVDSDFLRLVLGPQIGEYSVNDGWHVSGSGCRLGYGRPLICYEYFCERFDTQDVKVTRQLSRALKTVYANVFAGQHMLVLEDINRISANKLRIVQVRLEALKDLANRALRQAIKERLSQQPGNGHTVTSQ